MFYPLMLLDTFPDPFSDSNFIFEPKYDGIRLEFSNIDSPKLYSRNGTKLNIQFPEILEGINKKVVLDGELIGLTKEGIEDFEGVMKRFRMKKEDKIKQHITINPVCYKVFDILNYKGEDLRNRPLCERKTILDEIIADNEIINKVPYIKEDGISFFTQVKENNLEGMVAKKLSSAYKGKRSSSWLKIINWLNVNAIITGYRKKDNAILCSHEDGKPLGLVLYGMSPAQREAFFKIANKIKVREDSQFFYLEPLIKCRLKGRGFLSNGILRSPIFIEFII